MFRFVVSRSAPYRCSKVLLACTQRTAALTQRAVSRYLSIVKVSRTQADSTIGLFGLRKLQESSDFGVLVNEAVNSINSVRAYLRSYPSLPASQTLALLDTISVELCTVLDAAEFCRNVHKSEEFKAGAESAFEQLSHFMHELNGDNLLYLRLESVKNGPEWSSLTQEEKLFTENLRLEFQAEGIHLSGEAKQLAMQQRAEVVNNETLFGQNINRASSVEALVEVGPFKDKDEMLQLKAWITPHLGVSADRLPKTGDASFYATKQKGIVNALLGNISEEPVRRQLWHQAHLHPSSNVEPLGALIKSRQALARSLGYESYAHKAMYNKAFKSPGEVDVLLQDLSAASREHTMRELRSLRALKQETLPAPSSSSKGFLAGIFGTNSNSDSSVVDASQEGSVLPWDIQYLRNIKSSQSTGLEQSRQRAQNKVREYLSVENCLKGLQLVSESLFGISLRREPLGPYEGWLQANAGANLSASDPNRAESEDYLIQKYSVVDESTGATLGTVYFDLFGRDNKFPGAAHFTVQCGCERTFVHTPDGKSAINATHLSVKQQLPIVALVFHFKAPLSAHIGSDSALKHCLLSLKEVETLHHEWGHALHSLLSKTRFQHLSGTRGGSDFVEVPSHWMEYFARCPVTLSKWARHYLTGTEVPPQLLQTALEGTALLPAVDLQMQILYSAVDQHVFGTGIGDVSTLSPQAVFERANNDLLRVQQQYTVLPVGEVSSMNMLDHGHLVNYGGAYYAYLFAHLYSAQIWHKHFAADPLNRDAGRFLREHLLQHGSSQPSAPLLRDVAGGALDPSYYLRDILK